MNPLLRRPRKFGKLFNHTFKLNKQWHTTQTKHMPLVQFTHEAPVLFNKMWEHNSQFNQPCYSTDAKSEHRYWKKISFDKPGHQTPGLPFKIVSYNILAQDILVEHLYLYTHSNEKYLKWKHRLDRLTEKIVEQRPDILCLQEVQENHLGDIMTCIKSRLPSMTCIFKNKTGDKVDGCAIIYNNKLFELVHSHGVEFYRPEIELLNRHNIALIAKLYCKSKKEANIIISTTHLLFNPRREDVRLAQVMVLLAELERHSIIKPGKPDRVPVILTGDFNSLPTSAPFHLINSGKLCYESLARKSLTITGKCGSPPTGKCFISEKLGITDNCQYIDRVESDSARETKTQTSDNAKLFSTGTLTHGLNLRSAYNHFDGMSYGSIFQGGWVTVDHLFYSKEDNKKPQPKNGSLKLLSVYQLPNVNHCRRMGLLPNQEHGSDHLMLAAQFYLNFPNT